VKTSTIVSAVLGFALLSSACAKSTDLAKMQEETIATVKIYNAELDALQRRFDELNATKGPSSDANKLLEAAGQAINTGRTTAASAPTSVAAAAKTSTEALTQEHYALIAKLDHSIATASDNLAGYEAFISSVAYASTKPAVVPAGEPASGMTIHTTGSDDISDAPAAKMPAGTTPSGHVTDIPCSAEIALQCPEGQIDACIKSPTAATHACVAK
jgi:hypothetical protein